MVKILTDKKQVKRLKKERMRHSKFLNCLRGFILIFILGYSQFSNAQLKFIVEDFEGLSDGTADFKENGLFTFGKVKPSVDSKIHMQNQNKYRDYLGQRALKIEKKGKLELEGWGKGVGLNIELNPQKDYLNFFIYEDELTGSGKNVSALKIELQEDDDGNNVFDKDQDDCWTCVSPVKNGMANEQNIDTSIIETKKWKLISIPLNKFKDENTGGDDIFNIGYKNGRLFSVIISFLWSNKDSREVNEGETFFFDFLSFSRGRLQTGKAVTDPPSACQDDFCYLGAWSKEGNSANFTDIGIVFENNFKPTSEKKLGIVHFFQAFAADGGTKENHFPSQERIDNVLSEGYIPMITLENHFVNTDPKLKQPNLYSIVEGHFDAFFRNWANRIKQVNGMVFLRILHEFNGNWYPWCIAKNDKNPKLLIEAYRHIHDIFKKCNVTNVKFIWCPNSMSIPQEKWNFIMDAYPGDEYVDFLGIDIYNGAGDGFVWRSFRKEGIENYFLLTQYLPQKPLFVCESASRERKKGEPTAAQSKDEWIRQMSEALKTDMSKIRLLTWFNEKETFKINSSPQAKDAYLNYIMKDDYFKNGAGSIFQLKN